MNISKYIGKTFPAGKSAKELGIDTSRKFVVVEAFAPFLEEDVVTIACDEDDAIPIVRRIHDGRTNWIPLDNLAYLEEEDEKIEYTVDPEKDVDTTDFLSGMNYIPRLGDKVRKDGVITSVCGNGGCAVGFSDDTEVWFDPKETSDLTLISRAPRTLTKAEAEKMLSEKLGEEITIE